MNTSRCGSNFRKKHLVGGAEERAPEEDDEDEGDGDDGDEYESEDEEQEIEETIEKFI